MVDLSVIKDDEFLEEDEDDIVVLTNNFGEEIEFIEIAGIVHQGNFYAILQPKEEIEGVADDEAFVFKITKDDQDNDKFEMVLDEEIIDAVFSKYNELLDNVGEE